MLPRKIPDCKVTIYQNSNTHSIDKPIPSSEPGGSLVSLHLDTRAPSPPGEWKNCHAVPNVCSYCCHPRQVTTSPKSSTRSLLPSEEEVPPRPRSFCLPLRGQPRGRATSCNRIQPTRKPVPVPAHQMAPSPKHWLFFLLSSTICTSKSAWRAVT